MKLKHKVSALVAAVVAAGGFVAGAAANASDADPAMDNSTALITTLADPATTSLEITEVWYDI